MGSDGTATNGKRYFDNQRFRQQSSVQAHLEFVSNLEGWWDMLCAAEPAYLD